MSAVGMTGTICRLSIEGLGVARAGLPLRIAESPYPVEWLAT